MTLNKNNTNNQITNNNDREESIVASAIAESNAPIDTHPEDADFDPNTHEREVIGTFLGTEPIELNEWKTASGKHKAIKIGDNNNEPTTSSYSPSHSYTDSGRVPVLDVAESRHEERQQIDGIDTRNIHAVMPAGTAGDSRARTISAMEGQINDTHHSTHGTGDLPATLDTSPAGVGESSRRDATRRIEKKVTQAKSDTREIQRRINEHRGYALEDKGGIMQERIALKTWCSLHTLEEYAQVMHYLTTVDKFWRKEENKYRIGGVALLKSTPEALARIKAPVMGMAANGHNSNLVEWKGQWMTVEQADEQGYNGGFGLYN